MLLMGVLEQSYKISMDFIEGLPSSHGKSTIFVVVDRLSKYAHFIHLSHLFTATQIVQVFLDNVYMLHGLPKVIVSDRHKAKWVSLAEYWYNTTYHTSLKTTPYEVLFGQPPPNHIAYVQGQCLVDIVDRTLAARESMIPLLQFYLERVQQRMKDVVDAKRTDKELDIEQWVYLKLQPHRQVSLRTEMFHLFQLKKYKGPIPDSIPTLPQCNVERELTSLPMAILDRRLGKKNGFKWSDTAQATFDQLKQAMTKASMLKLLEFNELFILETDASYGGIRAVLQQGGYPVAYYSKTLASRDYTLSTYEK
nr:hypothetical protein [Tanacetum cinerariifolium]